MKLNPAQTAAACHSGGPALVLAGPGSGKTTVLIGRVKHLIETGTRPSEILVVTFTKAAAKEMKSRFLRSCPQRGEGVTFSTCHSLFFRILRQECGYTNQNILTGKERQRIMREVLRSHGIEAGEDTLRYVASDISRVKNTVLTEQPDPFSANWCTSEEFRSIYNEYNDTLHRRHRIEFDDMQLLCLELFENMPEVLQRRQQDFCEILIDEYQDINPVQNRLLCLLAQPQDHLFAVGDEDQSIYAFRGSTPQLILDFARAHPGTKRYLLDTNYRCSEEIIVPACRLIGENALRTPKEIRGIGRTGGRTEVIAAADQRTQAQRIAADIRRHLKDGVPPEEMAVLYRSRGTEPYLTHAFGEQMIPYRMKQQERDVYTHWITQDLFAYFELARNRDNSGALLRILNRPKRNLPRELFTRAGMKWRDYERQLPPEEAVAWKKLGRDLDRIGRFKPYAALHYIIEGIGYGEVLKHHAAIQQIPEEVLTEVTDFLYAEAAGYETFAAWKEAVDLQRERRAQDAAQRQDGVLLTTIHGAKGLEFDCVYLTDVNEGLFPPKSAVTQLQIEEERRLCYVAMTRARKELKLYSVSRFHSHELQPSRFIAEAGLAWAGRLPSNRD